MEIREKKSADKVICYVNGEIDVTTSPELRKFFDRVTKDKVRMVILNLKDVTYIDSSGLATFVEGLQHARGYGGKLRLTNLSGKARSLFEITRLEKLFEIYETEEAALTA